MDLRVELLVDGLLSTGFKTMEAILNPGYQPDGVGLMQASGVELDHAIQDSVELKCRGGPVRRPLDIGVKVEACERAQLQGALAQPVQIIDLACQLVFQMLASGDAFPDGAARTADGICPGGSW